MAVIINLTDGKGSKTEEFKQDNTPATQGNVINTLDAYNEKIKKEYYDKTQARADENALQESIQKIVQLLAKSAWNDIVTIPENTKSEDTDNDRLKKYLGSFDEDNKKTFDEAGLVQKINIIANILSGDTKSSKQWGADVHGNNIGAGESTLNVPVIGITRQNPEYTAEFKTEGSNRTLTISGLNNNKIIRPNGNEDTIEASEITVLSEKQVAEMICCSVKSVLGGFDSQIANIVSYLLFQEGDLPDSYKFVLNHTNDKGIKSAPLYITYEDSNSNIGEYTGPAYYIHDLNGDIEETPDYVINKDNITTLISEGGWKPTEASLFTLKANKKLDKINVLYNGEDVYTLSVPKKTVTLNLHDKTRINETIFYSYSVLGKVIEGNGEFKFNEDGIAFENFPQGSIVTITMPDGFTDTLFYEEKYEADGMGKSVVVDLSKNDAHIYNKKLTFNIKDKETNTEIRYYSGDLSLKKGLSYPGYTATNESVFGVEITDNQLLIKHDKIKKEIDNNTDEFTFDCDITWENRKVNVTLEYSEGGELKTDTKTLVTGQEISPKNIEGYDFKGWKGTTDNEPYTTVPFTDGPTLELTAVQTLKKYNCIYDLNGGQWNNGAEHPSTHEHVFTEDTNILISSLVSRPGYTFKGWYTRPELENINYNVNHFQNEDCTYYAKWEEKSYTINFNLGNLETGANPMFKYKSLTVKASNLPITIGQAYATGYYFVGWAKTEGLSIPSIEANNSDSYAGVEQIQITDFDSNNTINLSAVWEAKDVPVIEEYYYEIEGSNGKYDLSETSEQKAKVGKPYEATTYTANFGFEENTGKEQSLTVMPTGNIYKRYFDRRTFTVTYKNIEGGDKEETYTYSDNAQELKSIKDLTGTDNKLFDCWLKVETGGSKTPIKHISAYHFGDIEVVARYNQDAPVLNSDFTVNTTTDTITISTLKPDGKIIVNGEGIQPTAITSDSPKTFNYGDVYPENVATTKSCFVYFEGNDATNQNPSSAVDILLIYHNNKPERGKDYDLDSATSTVKKLSDTEGLEYRIGDSNYFELTGNLTIERNKTIYIRKKATFSRFASDDVSESFSQKAAAVETALVDSNFKVVNVSYKEQGHIEIKKVVFEGNHGALQYKTGSGNAWLDVNRTESTNGSTTLYVDKPCTVSFRYNESDEYRASSKTLNLTVDIKTHTVTFDVSNIPSSNYTFTGLTQVDGEEEKLKLSADSGSQLCKVENYIKNVNNWTVTGYNMDIDTKLGRAVSFLKKKDDGTYYNEASVIDSDITLLMNWKPIQFINKNYTDVVLLGDNQVSLPQSLLAEYTDTFDYGKEVTINLVNDLTKLVDDETLKKILNVLDQQNDKLLSLSELHYKFEGSNYVNSGVEVTSTPDTHTFEYFNELINFGADPEVFPKFASKFTFVDATDVEDAIIQFRNDIDSGDRIGTVESVSYYGGTGLGNFKFVSVSDNILNVYYASDPRAETYNTIDQLKVTENISGGGSKLTVIFHSAYIVGADGIGKFYPRKEVPGIIAIKQTITDQGSIYTMTVNTDDGSTVIKPIGDWTITTTNVSAYQTNGN